jgi:succinyl-CoA synthetase alpha subunit
VILIGEIGGTDEEDAAAYIGSRQGKPVVAFIRSHRATRQANGARRRDHHRRVGGPQHKVDAFNAAGTPVADTIADIADRVADIIGAGVS